jgi:peptidoglycan/LPS O-acetylase OafA/YrhL
MTTVAPSGSTDAERGHAAPARLPSLTGLRFAAAFLVFGFHADIERIVAAGPTRNVMDWVFGPGAAGVSFFFVLSGFVLTWSVRPGETAWQFWRRRIAKIYPNHAVTATAALAVAAVTGAYLSAAVVVPNLLLVQAWVPDSRVFFGLNTVSWSLACEAFFYAMFPLLHRALVRRLPGAALWPATVACFALVWLVPVASQLLRPADRYWFIWVFPVTRLPEFVAGMLLARIVQEGRWRLTRVWPIAVLTGVTYLTSRWWLPDDFRLVAGSAVPLALFVAAVGAADAAGRRGPFSTRGAVWLGEVSYAFYLVHQLVLRLFTKVAGPGHPPLVGMALILVALAVAITGSAVLHRFLEVPAMRLIGGRRRGVRAAVVAG